VQKKKVKIQVQKRQQKPIKNNKVDYERIFRKNIIIRQCC
jgi:hypothetical protein